MRLFVAIDLPDSWKALLGEVEKSIGWLGFGVKWVSTANMHLTLKFLGDTDERDLDAVKDALKLACKSIDPFTIQMRGTGVFPAPNKPRVYWAGIRSESGLTELQQLIEHRMVECGYPPEEQPFRPHLTLARIKVPVGKQRMTDALLSYKIESEPLTVIAVLLIQSHLEQASARYEIMQSVSLAAK